MSSLPPIGLRLRRVILGTVVLGFLGSIAGCAVGPDFETPEAPSVTSYLAGSTPGETVSTDVPAGQGQRFVSERDIPAEWWRLFQSPALDALVQQALSDSPRLAQAEAKLVRAQEQLQARTGTRYPRVDLAALANRIGVESDALESPALAEEFPFTLSSASVGVSYTLDLFGKNRRELEALRASVDYQQFELEAARLMLAGNVVAAAIEEASLRQQLEATETAVAIQTRRLEIVRRLEQLGAAPRLDVVMQDVEVARTRSTVPALRQRLEQTRHRLAVYLGQPPGAVQLPELRLAADLQLPTELPLSLPSALARQRPDIRAAEALLHEASARVGVATANFYPQITLSATAGGVAIPPLLNGTAGFALLAASLAQPLFNGGANKAEKRLAEAAFEQAGAAYREVVLSGLQDVADTLVALDADARTLSERANAAKLAKTAFEIASQQHEAGGVSLLALLDAERQYVATTVDETRAIGERFADSAALFQALGGGWWNAETTATQP